MASKSTSKRLLFSVSIKDCEIQTFTVGGPGGGGKDTSNTGVRLTHKPSSATATAREERSQQTNKVRAFRRLCETKEFKAWHRLTVARLSGEKSIEQQVDEAMAPGNIRIEVKDEDGRWAPAPTPLLN